MKFNNGKEMLDGIKNHDLYNPETGEYVFLYNDVCSIAVYKLDDNEVTTLRRETKDTGESWSGYLGIGGYIYDDPSNIEWCNENYKGNWECI